MNPRPTNRETAGLIAGFGLWSLAFALLYAAHGTICAAGSVGDAPGRILLIGLWAAMLAAQVALTAWLLRRLRRGSEPLRLVRLVSLALAIAAIGATVWTGLPVLILEIC